MLLKTRYLKYSPEITLEIFTLVYNKLIEEGCDSIGLKTLYNQFNDSFPNIQVLEDHYFRSCTDRELTGYEETTVQEILGYDPFVKEGYIPGIDPIEKNWSKATKEELLEEAKRRYPIGTVFSPAHVDDGKLIITNCNFAFTGRQGNEIAIVALTDEGEYYKMAPKYGNELYDRIVYCDGEWAKIISLPKVKEAITEYVECLKDYSTQFTKGKIYQTDYRFGMVLQDDLGRKNGFGDVSTAKTYFKPSTKEAFEAQNKPKQPLKQAVHCTTQEEWDFVLSKFNPRNLKNGIFSIYSNDTVIIISNPDDSGSIGCYGSIPMNKGIFQILSFQEWCDLNGYIREAKHAFEVGKWYKNSRSNSYAKFDELSECYIMFNEVIENGKYSKGRYSWYSSNVITTPIDLAVIQQHLPDGHPDKIQSNPEFKVGDWCMWKAGDKVDIFKICNTHNSGNRIHGNNGNHYDTDKIRHATPEEINNHLISIGQIPAGDPIGIGLMPGEDGRFRFNPDNVRGLDFEISGAQTNRIRTIGLVGPVLDDLKQAKVSDSQITLDYIPVENI